MEAFDGHLLDSAVHPLDLTNIPGVVRLGEPVLVSFASQIISKRICRGQTVLRLRGCSANWMSLLVRI